MYRENYPEFSNQQATDTFVIELQNLVRPSEQIINHIRDPQERFEDSVAHDELEEVFSQVCELNTCLEALENKWTAGLNPTPAKDRQECPF